MNKHTMSDLYSMQAAPLSVKIKMTARRIRDWVDEYGQDGVYVSFSGGKDSTAVRKHKVTKSTFSYFDIGEFGKTVFLTKSEAEAKLKELRCNNG